MSRLKIGEDTIDISPPVPEPEIIIDLDEITQIIKGRKDAKI